MVVGALAPPSFPTNTHQAQIQRSLPYPRHRAFSMRHRYYSYDISYSRGIFHGERVESRTGGDDAGGAGAYGARGAAVHALVAGAADGPADGRIVYKPAAMWETAGADAAGKGRVGAAACLAAPAEGKLVDGGVEWHGRSVVGAGSHRDCRFNAPVMGRW